MSEYITAAQHNLNRIEADVRAKWGDKTDVSDIAAVDSALLASYGTGQRVKVVNFNTGHVRFGTVSRTTGWKPALLVIHRITSHGSWDVLGPNDRIVAYRVSGRYVPVTVVVNTAEVSA